MRQLKRLCDGPGDKRHQEILCRDSDEHVEWARDKNVKVFFRKRKTHSQHYEAEN